MVRPFSFFRYPPLPGKLVQTILLTLSQLGRLPPLFAPRPCCSFDITLPPFRACLTLLEHFSRPGRYDPSPSVFPCQFLTHGGALLPVSDPPHTPTWWGPRLFEHLSACSKTVQTPATPFRPLRAGLIPLTVDRSPPLGLKGSCFQLPFSFIHASSPL